jgi:hypothetical protein
MNNDPISVVKKGGSVEDNGLDFESKSVALSRGEIESTPSTRSEVEAHWLLDSRSDRYRLLLKIFFGHSPRDDP